MLTLFTIKTMAKNLKPKSKTKIFLIQGIFRGFKEIRIFNKENYFIKFFNDSIIPFANWMLSRFI